MCFDWKLQKKTCLLFFMTLFSFTIIALSPFTLTGQDIGLLVSPGKLSKVHAKYAGVDNCSQCHTEGKKTDTAKCLLCHKELSSRIDAGTGFHKDKKEDCISCHPEHHGEDFKLIEFDSKNFDHNETGYPLTGLHQPLKDCRRCHKPPNAPARMLSFTYLLKDTRCIGCHKDVHNGQLSESCQKCHNVDSRFQKARSTFDHNKSAFPLKGRHQKVDCQKCHKAGPGTKDKQWKGLRFKRCANCHADPHKPSFNQACSRCHNETSWREVSAFDHTRTRYPLEGKHSGLACSKCHHKTIGVFPAGPGETLRYRPVSIKCADCHDDFHRGQLGRNCETCHQDFNSFKQIETFDHSRTRFKLDRIHQPVTCAKCHPRIRVKQEGKEVETIKFKPIGTACLDCHRNYDHSRAAFKLTGKHKTLDCRRCHTARTPHTRRMRTTPKGLFQCRHCHRSPHPGDQPLCAQCHTANSWKVDSWL